VFADLDETIRRLLVEQVPIDSAQVDVSFDTPDREWSGRLTRPAVNCFLFDVHENLEFRELDWERVASNGGSTVNIKRAPARIDATYHVTTWARVPEDEHRLLWRVLSALMRHPVLPEHMLEGSLKEQPFPVPARAAQLENGGRPNAADLWQALDNRIRPSIAYSVTLALDPQDVITQPLVFSRHARVYDLDGSASESVAMRPVTPKSP